MFRDLETIANATPKDYLSHGPTDPLRIALQMISKAHARNPNGLISGTDVQETNYTFLYVGPGSGLIVKTLIDQGHIATGLETSKRGISMADPLVISYCNWSKPWETPFRNKYYDLALLNRYYQTILTPEEWDATVTEIKRVSKSFSFIS